MTFQPDPNVIRWHIHLAASREVIYRFFSTDEGRAAFWTESVLAKAGSLHFTFPGGQTWQGKILEQVSPHRYSVIYYGGSTATFELAEDSKSGTDLTLTDQGVPESDRM